MNKSAEQTTILIVDDEEIIRSSFQDQLEDLGYQVLLAENGRLGVEQILAESPDLVLTDLRMPEMSGLELIQQSKVSKPDIPIIVISGASIIGDAVEALRLGAYDYLIKPVKGLEILKHAVDQALDNARLVKENKAYQEHLETLVQERTQELHTANKHLEAINVRLRKIVQTTQGFSNCIDVNSISLRILIEFADHMCAAGGSIYLVEDGGLRLAHVIDEGHAPDFISFPLQAQSIFKKVVDTGQPLLIDDISAMTDAESSGWYGYKDGSLLAFPLPHENGNIMGLLTLHTKKSPPFVQEDKEIGAILASYSCEAIRSLQATDTLRESERRFRELADMLPLTVCEFNTNGKITYTNRCAHELHGYEHSELESASIFDMIIPEEKEKASVNALKLMLNPEHQFTRREYTAKRKDGSTFPVLAYSAPILQKEEVIGVRTVVVDISLLKKQQEQILKHAHFDSLTGLPNRFLTLDRLAQLIKEAQRTEKMVAVMFLDLDNFKNVNDTLGHEIGDKLLIRASDRLNDILREGDTVGRLGGDEFIILLGAINDADSAQPVAKHILKRFNDVFQLDERELVLTASLGIAIYPMDGDTPAELLRNADSAMYYSKEQGRNAYHYFTNEMNFATSRRMLLEEHLHGAVDRGELSVNYQPLIDIRRKTIVGAEALLRWNSPELGQVSPEEFIPILEQNGQIIPVGRYVLLEALKKAAKWQKLCPFNMAVNLSPRQFRDPGLLDYINNVLQKTGLSGDVLKLEITEGVLMNVNNVVDDLLLKLTQMKISIVMDDFGTGYSSLSYLRTYPFNSLKIDRSFVNEITTKSSDRELISAAITMGHNLGLKVVAEGVETAEQLSILETLNCDMAQGYFFSKPVTAEIFPELIAKFSDNT